MFFYLDTNHHCIVDCRVTIEVSPSEESVLYRRSMSRGVQIGSAVYDSWTQTRWYRKLNKITQYEQCELLTSEKIEFMERTDILQAIEDKVDLYVLYILYMYNLSLSLCLSRVGSDLKTR